METLTINELNSINTKKNKESIENEITQKEVEQCLIDVSCILKQEWHNVSAEWYSCGRDHFYSWNKKPFSIVAEMYMKNGIEISFYQPHRIFSFKLSA